MSDPLDWRSDPGWPDVDVVMPILNEADHLATALSAITSQAYPGNVGVIMAIGPSSDATADIAAGLVADNPAIRVVENPTGKTPSALNLAIRAGNAPVIVRVDGHSHLSDGYISRAVETLRRTGASNVGGMQVPEPRTRFEEAVATATTSWLGTGGASYRTGGVEGSVDTVYLGVFDRVAIESVGLYDETLIRNQDYELNIRLRAGGHVVLLDPELAVGYRPRGSWTALFRQYFEYGAWKAVVVRLHPGSARARQLLPVAVFAANVAGIAIGCFRPAAFSIPLGYLSALALASRRLAKRRWPTLAGVFATMHLSWAFGFVKSALGRRPTGEA